MHLLADPTLRIDRARSPARGLGGILRPGTREVLARRFQESPEWILANIGVLIAWRSAAEL
jgi:hypothetical protein